MDLSNFFNLVYRGLRRQIKDKEFSFIELVYCDS
jgi:hypothetical protein